MKGPRLAVALVHHPVLDRRGDRVTTAVTNLDIHDIARAARTFGAERFYVVTPVAEQRLLVERILGHWREGFGATSNPDRRQALDLVELAVTLDEALERWTDACGGEVLPLLTAAGRQGGLGYGACRNLLGERPGMLILGTGWGLAPEFFERGWPVLDPIRGCGDYNHLSVRAAAAILLDRLLGRHPGDH